MLKQAGFSDLARIYSGSLNDSGNTVSNADRVSFP